jgi:hypothetical protein
MTSGTRDSAGKYAIQIASESRLYALPDECICARSPGPARFAAPIALACKNPVLRPDVGTTFHPLHQSFRESRMHWNRFLRCFGLARAYYSVHDGARDAHRALAKINATPFQAEYLALPQPG